MCSSYNELQSCYIILSSWGEIKAERKKRVTAAHQQQEALLVPPREIGD